MGGIAANIIIWGRRDISLFYIICLTTSLQGDAM